MSLYSVALAPTAASATAVGASHSPGAGAILIDGTAASGGVATLGAAQLITLVSGGNDTGVTFVINGTDADGKVISENVTGASGATATSTKHFKTVTSITHAVAIATTLSVGCTIDSVSASYFPLRQAPPGRFSLCVYLVSGTATFETQDCYMPEASTTQEAGTWVSSTVFTGKSATFAAAYGDLYPWAVRLRATASSSGVLRGNFVTLPSN